MTVYDRILANRAEGKKMLAVLVDPDKACPEQIAGLCRMFASCPPDFIFVGGSLVCADVDGCIADIKRHTRVPVVLFPGNASQLSAKADAMLLLSLISGRNPEYLIGQHVEAAVRIARSGVEPIPTGYMLIDGGTTTSVEYISATKPIPHNKTDIAVATALAGQLLGQKLIYLEAGSGAKQPVSAEMIERIRQNITIPIIVGGGLRTPHDIGRSCRAGADMVVVGTAIEQNPDVYMSVCDAIRHA